MKKHDFAALAVRSAATAKGYSGQVAAGGLEIWKMDPETH
jgi:hypothetical protein